MQLVYGCLLLLEISLKSIVFLKLIMSISIVNPLNVEYLHENDEGEEVCVICQDALTTAQVYTLPECQHKYHTHCIVTWFRHNAGMCTDKMGGSKCPQCGNKGVNYTSTRKSRSWFNRYRTMSAADKMRYTMIMRESRKSTAPKQLLKIIEKYKTKEEEVKNADKEYKDFNKLLEAEPMCFSEAKNKKNTLRRKLWNKTSERNSCRQAIVDFPIVPIIIPTPIDLN